jgi:predicted lipopolysaccharide heptosyltransferase III
MYDQSMQGKMAIRWQRQAGGSSAMRNQMAVLDKKNIGSILLIQLGDIGDVVLTFPCIRALRENFPEAKLIVAVRDKADELIQDCPWADGVISVNKQRRGLAEQIVYQKGALLRLRRFHFDLAVDMRTGTRGAILSILSGARQRVGYYSSDGRLWRNRMFTHLCPDKDIPHQHVAKYYLHLLATYGLTTEHVWPEMHIPDERQQQAESLFRQEKIPLNLPAVIVQPFSLWRYKEWGIDKYAQLIDWIGSRYRFPVVLTGSPGEKGRASEIMNMCGKGVYDLVGRTSLGIFSAILKRSRLFIGGDSSGMHISAAVGTPTVIIFGPSSPVSWASQGKQHLMVQKDFPCVPCKQKGCHGSEISRCIEELTVEEVIPAVERQFSHRGHRTSNPTDNGKHGMDKALNAQP